MIQQKNLYHFADKHVLSKNNMITFTFILEYTWYNVNLGGYDFN